MLKHGTPSEFGDLTITFSVDFPSTVDTELAAGLEKLLPEFSAADMKIGSSCRAIKGFCFYVGRDCRQHCL